MSRQESGFSLVELLIVVSILATVALVVVPGISSTNPGGLNLAASEVAQAMRFARAESNRTGIPHGFTEESSAMRIRVFQLDLSVSPAALIYDIAHPISKKLYDVSLNALPYVQVDAITRSTSYRGTCNQTGNVFFDPKGTPWCADPDNILLQQMDVVLTRGSQSKIVRLDGITGRVSIQ